MTKKEYAEYESSVAAGLKGLRHVSGGPCPGCMDCGLDTVPCEPCKGIGYADGLTIAQGSDGEECERCDGTGRRDYQDGDDIPEDEYESKNEGSFRNSSCDVCNSHLAGNRYPAHARCDDDSIIHLDICTDCVYYLEYGVLDDMSMLEIVQTP